MAADLTQESHNSPARKFSNANVCQPRLPIDLMAALALACPATHARVRPASSSFGPMWCKGVVAAMAGKTGTASARPCQRSVTLDDAHALGAQDGAFGWGDPIRDRTTPDVCLPATGLYVNRLK